MKAETPSLFPLGPCFHGVWLSKKVQPPCQRSTAYSVFASICACMLGLLVMSTDVLLGRYTDACDMWSLGVIGKPLLIDDGSPPFVVLHMLQRPTDAMCFLACLASCLAACRKKDSFML